MFVKCRHNQFIFSNNNLIISQHSLLTLQNHWYALDCGCFVVHRSHLCFSSYLFSRCLLLLRIMIKYLNFSFSSTLSNSGSSQISRPISGKIRFRSDSKKCNPVHPKLVHLVYCMHLLPSRYSDMLKVLLQNKSKHNSSHREPKNRKGHSIAHFTRIMSWGIQRPKNCMHWKTQGRLMHAALCSYMVA